MTEKSIAMNITAATAARFCAASVLIRAIGFAAFVALGAQVRIPVPGTDVPMTLQLLAVLVAGLVLPWKQASAAMTLYLFAGSAGFPVFAPGSTGVLGLTGGYLMGFLPAAALVAVLRGSGTVRMLLAGSAGVVVVLGCGVAWRALAFAGDSQVAIATGFWPFLPKALLELGMAVALVRAIRTRSGGQVMG